MANKKKFIVTRDLSVERGEILNAFNLSATPPFQRVSKNTIVRLANEQKGCKHGVVQGFTFVEHSSPGFVYLLPTYALSEIVEQPIQELQPNDAWTTGTVIGGVRSDHWRETTIPTAEPTVVELPKVGVECREYAMHSVFKHAKYDLLWGVNSDYYPERGGYRDALKLYWEGHGTYNYLPCSELTLISEPTVKDCLTVEQPIELSDIVGPTYSLNTAEFDEQPKAINTEWLTLYACILYASEEVSKESAIEDAIENASNIYKLVIQRVKDSAVELQQDKQ
jgi:hypothetical protein